MAEKLAEVPEAWARLHRQGAGALLRAESRSLGLLQRAVRQQVAEAVLELLSLPRGADVGQVRRRAIRAIQRATAGLTGRVEEAIYQSRQLGRVAALEQLRRELRQVRRELDQLDVPEDEHPDDPPDQATDDTGTEQQDRMSAHAVATTFAGAWASRTLRAVLRWADTEEGSLPQLVRATIQASDPKIRQIAATETARAYNDEHDDGADFIAQENKGATWAPILFRIWSAILDRRTCAVCAGHDNEIVLAGMDFEDGDGPGDVHPGCRCFASLIVLPARLNGEQPADYDEEDGEEEAA